MSKGMDHLGDIISCWAYFIVASKFLDLAISWPTREQKSGDEMDMADISWILSVHNQFAKNRGFEVKIKGYKLQP